MQQLLDIIIHPAILLDLWPVLLCMAAATAAALISARLANRVDSRTVGLTTGGLLVSFTFLQRYHSFPFSPCRSAGSSSPWGNIHTSCGA